MRAIRNIAVLGVLLALLAGCADMLNALKADTNGDVKRADRALANTAKGSNLDHDTDGVVVSDRLWLSGSTLKLSAASRLPDLFSEPASFDGTVDSLRMFAERLTRLTHIPVKLAAGAEDAARLAQSSGSGSSDNNSSSGGGGAGGVPTSTTGLPPLPAGMANLAANNRGGNNTTRPVHIVYSHGDLLGLLDAAAARFGVYWKYSNGSIVFFYTETRVYQVSSIPGDSKVDTNVNSGASNSGGTSSGGGGSGSGGGGGGGGSSGSSSSPSVSSDNTTNIAMNAQLSVYSGLQAAIKSMLSPAGMVVPSPGTGSITVTDTPDVLERVGSFMEQQNRVLSRQILVNVTVLSVTLNGDDNYGINWGAVYQALGSQFSIANTFAAAATGAAQFQASVLTPSSRASGTTAIISALSLQGSVRRKTSASVTTLNDQPVPVQVATQESYLAQVSTTATLNVGTQTSLTPGTVTTGFNLTLLPHILDDGTVMMQFYTNISTLDSLNKVSSGTSSSAASVSIQVPTVSTRNFLQRVAIKSGETLVISGYEGITDTSSQQGIGTANNYALGGGFDANRAREVLVILLTPITMNGS